MNSSCFVYCGTRGLEAGLFFVRDSREQKLWRRDLWPQAILCPYISKANEKQNGIDCAHTERQHRESRERHTEKNRTNLGRGSRVSKIHFILCNDHEIMSPQL